MIQQQKYYFSEQFEAMQNNTRQEALAEKYKYQEQTVPLTEITPKIYPSLTDTEQNTMQDQPETVQVMGNALQTSIDSILTEVQEPIS